MYDLAPTNPHTDFTAEVRPIYTADGTEVPSEIGRGVYRDDTNEMIAVCGAAFRPVQHYEVLEPLMHHFDAEGYDVHIRNHDRRSLYDLVGKKGAFVQHNFAKNGAVMRTDIITGDFIQPTGHSAYLDSGPDTMLFKTSIFNSHNGSLAVRVMTSYERLICMNGMTRPAFSVGTYGKHTAGFSLTAMQAQIDNALAGMTTDAETFGRWARKRISREIADTMLRKTIAKLAKKNEKGVDYSERLIFKILNRFDEEDQTVWGLFQAVTWWQSHDKISEGSNPVTTLINRESRVAKMLRSPVWAELAG